MRARCGAVFDRFHISSLICVGATNAGSLMVPVNGFASELAAAQTFLSMMILRIRSHCPDGGLICLSADSVDPVHSISG